MLVVRGYSRCPSGQHLPRYWPATVENLRSSARCIMEVKHQLPILHRLLYKPPVLGCANRIQPALGIRSSGERTNQTIIIVRYVFGGLPCMGPGYTLLV